MSFVSWPNIDSEIWACALKFFHVIVLKSHMSCIRCSHLSISVHGQSSSNAGSLQSWFHADWSLWRDDLHRNSGGWRGFSFISSEFFLLLLHIAPLCLVLLWLSCLVLHGPIWMNWSSDLSSNWSGSYLTCCQINRKLSCTSFSFWLFFDLQFLLIPTPCVVSIFVQSKTPFQLDISVRMTNLSLFALACVLY